MSKKEEGIAKLIFEQSNRLGCIIRFNNTPKVANESVAEHSFYVTFIAMLLADYLAEARPDVNPERVMRLALLHDLEEVISGDIISIIKQGDLRKALDEINVKSMTHILKDMEPEIQRSYFDLWSEAKDKTTLEARIVEAADIIAACAYCLKEVHLGSYYFRETLEFLVKKILRYLSALPELREVFRAISEYALGYLTEDKKILDDLNRAVRITFEKEG